jgi:hypothetical protein
VRRRPRGHASVGGCRSRSARSSISRRAVP